MSSVLETVPLDLQVRLKLDELLDYVKQNPDKWVLIDGNMYQFHPAAISERLVPIINVRL